MIVFTDIYDFNETVRSTVASCLLKPECHKASTIFKVGDEKTGHHLYVDEDGWWKSISGVKVCGQYRRASPLSNFQAAVAAL